MTIKISIIKNVPKQTVENFSTKKKSKLKRNQSTRHRKMPKY